MYVYRITNTINGKIYIGISSKISDRHTGYYGSGKAMKRALLKYGKEFFKKDILDESMVYTYKYLQYKEKYYISLYNSTDPDIGYNISQGGDGNHGNVNGMYGVKHTDESKRKMRETIMLKKQEDPSYRVMSDSNRRKMSKLMSERNVKHPTLPNGHSEETKSKIRDTVLDGIKTGRIRREKGHKFSDDRKKLYSEMFSGEKNPFYGKKHTCETRSKMKKAWLNWGPSVVKKDINDNILKIYKRLGMAREEGYRTDLILRCCEGLNKTHKGFKWDFNPSV